MDLFRKAKQKLKSLAFGKAAERRAEKHLRKNGYEILETNYRCRSGEIDIVAREGEYLVFCEVKARTNRNFGTALEGITPAKMEKIRKAADHYLLRNELNGMNCRFDVVTIDDSPEGASVELIRNAF